MKKYIRSAVNPLENESVRTRGQFAEGSVASFRELQKLANDPSELVRYKVAANPNTPVEILEKLSKDTYPFVRNGVRLNPSAPQEFIDYVDAHCHDYSGLVDLRVEVQPKEYDLDIPEDHNKLAQQLRKELIELGYHVDADALYDYTENGDLMYKCICGDIRSNGEIYRIINALNRSLQDVHLYLYDTHRLLE